MYDDDDDDERNNERSNKNGGRIHASDKTVTTDNEKCLKTK